MLVGGWSVVDCPLFLVADSSFASSPKHAWCIGGHSSSRGSSQNHNVRKRLDGPELDGPEHFEKNCKKVPGDAGAAAGATAGAAAAASAAAIDATTTFVVVKTMAAAEAAAAAAAPAEAPAAAPLQCSSRICENKTQNVS